MLDNTMLCRSRGKQFTKFLLIHYRDDRAEFILLHVKAFHLRLPLEDGRVELIVFHLSYVTVCVWLIIREWKTHL